MKKILPILLFAGSSLFASCAKKTPVVVEKKLTPIERLCSDVNLHTLVADTFSHKISDEAKVIEYNKLLKKYGQSNGNYIVVDKKNCVAKVYSPDGDVLYSSEVAVGRHVGDKRGGGYGVPGAKLRAYTAPGEYTVSRDGAYDKNSSNYKLYGDRVLALAGDHTLKEYQKTQVLALHRVPATPMGKLRENVFNNSTLKDNRVSFGCVNFLVESYDKMRSLIKGKGTKVYILPEEANNSLYLEKQKDGGFKFFQSKYRYESQEHNK